MQPSALYGQQQQCTRNVAGSSSWGQPSSSEHTLHYLQTATKEFLKAAIQMAPAGSQDHIAAQLELELGRAQLLAVLDHHLKWLRVLRHAVATAGGGHQAQPQQHQHHHHQQHQHQHHQQQQQQQQQQQCRQQQQQQQQQQHPLLRSAAKPGDATDVLAQLDEYLKLSGCTAVSGDIVATVPPEQAAAAAAAAPMELGPLASPVCSSSVSSSFGLQQQASLPGQGPPVNTPSSALFAAPSLGQPTQQLHCQQGLHGAPKRAVTSPCLRSPKHPRGLPQPMDLELQGLQELVRQQQPDEALKRQKMQLLLQALSKMKEAPAK